jgi:RNA-directed DNA polymerase
MYEGLGRRGGHNRTAGVRAREIPVDFHEGDHWAFLRRHGRAARNAAIGSKRERRDFARCLRDRTADLRNIRCAIDYLAQEPDKAPGPNGRRLEDLDQRERLSLARAISQVFREGTYVPGPIRPTSISKGAGRGTRTLAVANIEDRVAQRALTQALQPFLDPQFDEFSFGFRPGRGREDALIAAEYLTGQYQAEFWIVDDIADAFGRVPHRRLLDDLRARGIDTAIRELVERTISNGTNRGLQQGSPLSPLLLNVYLDHVLDRSWKRGRPNMPLIRTADDILIIVRSEAEAEEAYRELAQILIAAGMPLKGNRRNAIRNIDSQGVDWLGYRIQRRDGIIQARIGEKAWGKLGENLQLAHERPKSPIRANETIRCWITQQGAALSHEDENTVLAQIQRMAEKQGFDETIPPSELRLIAGDAIGKFGVRRYLFSLSLLPDSACGSALRHRFFDTGDGETTRTEASSSSDFTAESIEYDLFLAALRTDGRPGTAAGSLLMHRRTRERNRQVFIDGHSDFGSALVTAALRGLESLGQAARVRLWAPAGSLFTRLGECATGPGNRRRLPPARGRLGDATACERFTALFEWHRVTVTAYPQTTHDDQREEDCPLTSVEAAEPDDSTAPFDVMAAEPSAPS